MRLLYSTTSALKVELTERFFASVFRLYFADEFNMRTNPPSSNPYRIYTEFTEIFDSNDRMNPKLVFHFNGLKKKIDTQLAKHDPNYAAAMDTIDAMGMHGIRPVLAILEGSTYEGNGKVIIRAKPGHSGSPTSIEYYLGDVHGPKHADPELHLNPCF